MAEFVRGDIVVVDFPNSATPDVKRRPALVVASWSFGNSTDFLLGLISSQNSGDPYSTEIQSGDTINGSLHRQRYLRPTYLWACQESRILRKVCQLKPLPLSNTMNAIRVVLA